MPNYEDWELIESWLVTEYLERIDSKPQVGSKPVTGTVPRLVSAVMEPGRWQSAVFFR